MKHTCLNCERTFEPLRTDAVFCQDTCKAEYYRLAGSSKKHVPLEKMKSKVCEHCGNMFWFNAYADRGGARVPSYCKDSCRIAAFRLRKRDELNRQREARNNPNSFNGFAERVKQQQKEQAQKTAEHADFRDALSVPRRWDALNAYKWLGVPAYAEKSVCDAMFRKLNKQHHPDMNNGKVWKHLAIVNAAYDYLKRSVF